MVKTGLTGSAVSRLNIEEIALFSVIDLVASTAAMCEWRTYQNGVYKQGEDWYRWNVEPNQNENAFFFKRMLFARLLRFNEALVFQRADRSLYLADMQLDFMWEEMQRYKSMMTTLNSATSVLEASNAVLLQYERPADQSESAQNRRAGYGQTYYDKYAGKAATPAPTGTLYRVQVGAYSKRENADRQLAAVQGKGFDALIKKVGDLYKVQTGAYSVKANAEAQFARVKAAGFEDAYITTDSSGTVVATSPQESEPTYTTYVVKDGDTLWLIAKKLLGNGNRWSEIANLNGIKGTIIYAGQKLKIPD